jgi:outer membrane protein assembly factor BamB
VKKVIFLAIISGLILLPFCSFVYAKKISFGNASPKIAPLIYKGIKFIISNTIKDNKVGYVQAWDLKTGKKVWEKKVYSVVKIPFFLEEDIFIISLSIEDGRLVVVSSDGREYKIDIPKAILNN